MEATARGIIRQGDVLLIPVDEIPANVAEVKRDRGRIVLAHGESGHSHCVLDDPATLFVGSDLDEMADRFLKVEQDVQLTHEEHNVLTIPAGNWRVRRQREYSPEEIRVVAD